MQISAICAELMKLDGKFWPGESLNINFSDLDLHFIAADRLQKKKNISIGRFQMQRTKNLMPMHGIHQKCQRTDY